MNAQWCLQPPLAVWWCDNVPPRNNNVGNDTLSTINVVSLSPVLCCTVLYCAVLYCAVLYLPSITATSRTRVLEAEHCRELPGEVEQPPEQRWTCSRDSVKLFNYSRTNSAIYHNIDTEHILVPLPQLGAVSQY